ncbi:hypothetical protein p12 [Rose leaf rosette-associated virus]|uniref:Uncharacterized protein n=1 Tax=Rose leaf rosette-associated virus TaxID=1543207 RepID=A0A088MJV3_9CLOS|nr:hypothetical protein p12 [Rose leaf rosette-associated virus]AIN39548.1 hypothetical protein p12 [Rose leaf rosette-associated virus]
MRGSRYVFIWGLFTVWIYSDTTFPAYGICGEKIPLFRVEDKYGLTCPITMFGHILTGTKDPTDYMDLEETIEHKCAVGGQSTGPEVDCNVVNDVVSQDGATSTVTAEHEMTA